jgi:hypothetical protein
MQEYIVQNHNNPAKAETAVLTEPTERRTERMERIDARPPWHAEVGDLLMQAAVLSVKHGVELDGFMQGAWSAYVESRPGMRDYLEEMQLRDQLDEIRKLGKMADA